MNVRPKKYLGQHFLTDLSVARRIAGALRADRCRTVLEVGCGTGVLTQFLLERDEVLKKVVDVFVLTLAIRGFVLYFVQLRIAKVNTKTPTTFFST